MAQTARTRRASARAYAVLGVILAGGLYVRLRGIGSGLPYVYYYDESTHAVTPAVRLFEYGPNPHYLRNPSGFTYLVHLVLRTGVAGDPARVARDYVSDPATVFLASRLLATALGLAAVATVFAVGRRLWGTVAALAAAAVLGFAFLAVTYSRIAVGDVGVLLFVAPAVYAAVRVQEEGRPRHYVLAGAAAGLASGFKYSAGLLLAPLMVAAVARLRGGRGRNVLLGLVAAGVAAAVLLVLSTPYLLLDVATARSELGAERLNTGRGLWGQRQASGVRFYADALGWGFGFLALGAAAAGLVAELARGRVLRAALLALVPVALFLLVAVQARYWGRWLLPALPILALLAGRGIAAAAELARRIGPRPRGGAVQAAVALVLTTAVVWPSLRADMRTAEVRTRADTRALARDFLARSLPAAARVVIDPGSPAGWYSLSLSPAGPVAPAARRSYSSALAPAEYSQALAPGLLERYRRHGTCVVQTTSLIRGRAENEAVRRRSPAAERRAARALAYYRALARESEVIFRATPFGPGARPVRFDFDLSYNLHPEAYVRPGPIVTIYRLRACRPRLGPLPRALRDRLGAFAGRVPGRVP